VCEPWNNVVAVLVGLPLCFAALAILLAVPLGILIAPYVPDLEDDL